MLFLIFNLNPFYVLAGKAMNVCEICWVWFLMNGHNKCNNLVWTICRFSWWILLEVIRGIFLHVINWLSDNVGAERSCAGLRPTRTIWFGQPLVGGPKSGRWKKGHKSFVRYAFFSRSLLAGTSGSSFDRARSPPLPSGWRTWRTQRLDKSLT